MFKPLCIFFTRAVIDYESYEMIHGLGIYGLHALIEKT